jgi:hypothetical protein
MKLHRSSLLSRSSVSSPLPVTRPFPSSLRPATQLRILAPKSLLVKPPSSQAARESAGVDPSTKQGEPSTEQQPSTNSREQEVVKDPAIGATAPEEGGSEHRDEEAEETAWYVCGRCNTFVTRSFRLYTHTYTNKYMLVVVQYTPTCPTGCTAHHNWLQGNVHVCRTQNVQRTDWDGQVEPHVIGDGPPPSGEL